MECKLCIAKWKADIGRSTTSESSSADIPSTTIERNVTLDNIKVKGLTDKVRIKCTEVLYSALATNTETEAQEIMNIAMDVEQAAFAHFTAASDAYKSKLRSLVANLRDKNNPFLRYRVLAGEIPPEKFAVMTAEEMMSDERKKVIEQVQKANMEEATTAKPTHAVTDIFKCAKCKQRKCTYYQMQTRSADEPMTTFVTCQVCDNRWKFC
ncbi:RNA polymerase II elongation factor [Kappamyces sp. JEL0829]|nr:RNA polymerase II elongation factor [Kappamyces sp. JEL0829]